jgi:hypothetical protein
MADLTHLPYNYHATDMIDKLVALAGLEVLEQFQRSGKHVRHRSKDRK